MPGPGPCGGMTGWWDLAEESGRPLLDRIIINLFISLAHWCISSEMEAWVIQYQCYKLS